MESLYSFIDSQFDLYKNQINPPKDCVFRAFRCTPLSKVKVVILGQDPYPGHGVADGLDFSARLQNKAPASLINVDLFHKFSQCVIQKIYSSNKGVVFILLGGKAAYYERFINKERNYVIKAPHPSPLSAYRGFFHSGVFKKANQLLEKENKKDTKLCKHCKTEIPKDAKVCPNCRKKQKEIGKWIIRDERCTIV